MKAILDKSSTFFTRSIDSREKKHNNAKPHSKPWSFEKVLDKYEQRIEDALAKGEYISASDLEDTRALFQEAAKNYLELQKTKSITLRVNKEDLIKVKAKARRNGLAYQTLVNLLIRRYVRGETEVVL